MSTQNEWRSVEHALQYLARADSIPHRVEGEAALLEEIPATTRRVLDLGTGDGRLLALVLLKCPGASGVAADFSPAMLAKARERFGERGAVRVVEHDLEQPLPFASDRGDHALRCPFGAVVSSFAIHHVEDERKRTLYAEVFDSLEPGGVFCNLEHVASPTEALHERFLDALGITAAEEDPSNKLLDVETQLRWLRELGFIDVDCLWKWRELALLAGRKPGAV